MTDVDLSTLPSLTAVLSWCRLVDVETGEEQDAP